MMLRLQDVFQERQPAWPAHHTLSIEPMTTSTVEHGKRLCDFIRANERPGRALRALCKYPEIFRSGLAS